MKKALVPITRHVNSRILLLRGQKVILDSDLATLYGVEVKHLNQQIKRNRKRFLKISYFEFLHEKRQT